MKLPNIFEKEVTPLSFSAGSVIFAEGQKRDSMYVVKSGAVELNVRDKNVEVVGTDGFFGEMALVGQAPRSATAIAKTDCIVIPISEKHFLFMVEETPFFALTVLRTLTARLRRMDKYRDKKEARIGGPNDQGPKATAKPFFGQLPAPKAQFHLTLLKFFEQSQDHFDSWKIHTVTRT
jgi:CRP/FNR family cyclic AMP-dependent transcriptional regulator